jgi:DNA adenine methylase
VQFQPKETIQNCDFESVMRKNDKKNTFIFIDPPYTRVFKKYSPDNNFGEAEQRRLKEVFKSLDNASAMIIIDKSDLTMELYDDWIKSSYTIKYGVNIKNRFNQDAEHLIICNY